MNNDLVIRLVTEADKAAIWNIIKKVIAKGDTYVFAPDSSKETMINYWCGHDKHTYVAILDHDVVGTFVIKDNFQDLGSHVANASFMTSPTHFGKGIGSTMGKRALSEAKKLGYKAMQFNIVVKSNERAVKLWQKLGFEIIGEVPEAFDHQQYGLTNAYIMWRKL